MVIMMMGRFEMILNWIRIVMMMEMENKNNSISNKSSCCDSNNHDNYDDCNVGDDDDDEEEEEEKEEEDNVADVPLCGDQGIDRVADISEDWTNTDWESDGNNYHLHCIEHLLSQSPLDV